MPVGDRAIVQEIVEVGIETTPGVAVASDIRLQGLTVELDTALELDRFGPMGNLFDTIAAPRQESATGSLSGYPTYTELPWVLSNVFGAATVTTPTGATETRRWFWAPSSSTPWTPKTWTIRRGVVNNSAELAAYGLLTGLSLSFSRTATPEIGGDLFARALDYAASVGASGLDTVDLVPILPAEVCTYLDDAAGSIGTTKLTRDFTASIEITDLFGSFWTLDCEEDSFGGHVPLKPSAGATLQLGNDGQGRALVPVMRAGDTRYLRIEATSAQVIDAGPPAYQHRLRIDAAVKVVDAPSRGDSDGLSTLEWSFGLFDDADFGGAIKITLDTNVAAF